MFSKKKLTLASFIGSFILFSYVPAIAQKADSGSLSKIDGVSGRLPTTSKPFLDEQAKSQKRSKPKGNFKAKPPISDEDVEEGLEDVPPSKNSTGSKLKPGPQDVSDSLSLPSSGVPVGQAMPSVEGIQNNSPLLVPQLELGPAAGVAAYLGQTLALEAKPQQIPGIKVNPAIAWVLDGKVVCQKFICEIPLDGKTLGLGATQLIIVVYNGYGSSFTKHVIQVLKSSWNPTKPFEGAFKKQAAMFPVKPLLDPVIPGSPKVYLPKGNAVHAYPDHISVLGPVPKAFVFKGRLKTREVAVTRIQDSLTGDWFVLGFSDVSFPGDLKENMRRANLTNGGVRIRAANKEKESAEKTPLKKNFVENIKMETPEISLVPLEGADIYVTRVRPSKRVLANAALLRKQNRATDPGVLEAQISTRIVVIAGQAKVNMIKPQKGSQSSVVLPSGVEFIVYEDGTVAPLARPNPKRMEKLMRMTITPEEIAEKQKAQKEMANANVAELVAKATKLLETEDYFEILSLMSPVEPRAKENPRILYLSGVANKGVYQVSEAKKKFEGALALDATMVDARWQLLQMALEDKEWSAAKQHLISAEPYIGKEDSRQSELPYYRGVIAFNLQEGFSARNSFTRALWEEKLDAALKQSSGSFLQTLGKTKNWSAVFPFGVQVLPSQEVPTEGLSDPNSPQKKLLSRSLVGAILSYDTAPNASESGWYFGTGLSAISMTNFPRSFKSSDLLTGEVSVSQTKVTMPAAAADGKGEESPRESLKISESFSQLVLAKKSTSQTFKLGLAKDKWTGYFAFDKDLVSTGDQSANALKANGARGVTLYASEAGLTVDCDFSLSGKYTLRKANDPIHSVDLDVTPSIGMPLSVRNSLKISSSLGVERRMQNVSQQVLSGGASVGFNSFLTPWMLFVPSVGYDAEWELKGAKKPGTVTLSILMTALL